MCSAPGLPQHRENRGVTVTIFELARAAYNTDTVLSIRSDRCCYIGEINRKPEVI